MLDYAWVFVPLKPNKEQKFWYKKKHQHKIVTIKVNKNCNLGILILISNLYYYDLQCKAAHNFCKWRQSEVDYENLVRVVRSIKGISRTLAKYLRGNVE